jgi:hypothetical protein
MIDFLEHIIVLVANWLFRKRVQPEHQPQGAVIGHEAGPEAELREVRLPDTTRAQHTVIFGKTGMGKTSLIKACIADDIRRNSGLILVDFHGDTTETAYSLIAQEEQRKGVDLSDRLIVIDPTDDRRVVGLNVLQATTPSDRFVQVAELVEFVKHKCDLATLGPRVSEVLFSAAYALSAAGMTLVEIPALLTNASFRERCLREVDNAEIVAFFHDRYDRASEGMQATLRDPVINKLSALLADPHFRHILGQHSTVPLVDALDRGAWIVLALPKGPLGRHAATLAGLFLTYLVRAVFGRRSRRRVSLYLDELQNVVEHTSGIDTLLAEARKFGIVTCPR